MTLEFVEEPAPPTVTIRAYVSDLFPAAPGEWPKAWAIVEVTSGSVRGRWNATLDVEELVNELRHKTGTPMRDNLAYEWSSEGFALDLGPARVSGPVAAWRVMLRQVLAEAGSTSELYETPGARPWRGDPAPVSVGDVLMGARVDHHGLVLSNTDMMVADVLGLDPSELVDMIGVGWSRYRQDGRATDSSDETTDVALYTWGGPPQLAVIPEVPIDDAAMENIDLWADEGVDPRGRAMIGVPHPTWDGLINAEAVTHCTLLDAWSADEIVTVVKSLRSRRRRAFGFCQHCGTYSAPEDKQGTLCWGCASMLYGLIF